MGGAFHLAPLRGEHAANVSQRIGVADQSHAPSGLNETP
jgi:hypothetical protein